MVSDQDIASCVQSLLRQAGPNAVASVNGVVRELEAKLGLDLSHKAGFIRDQIDLLLGQSKGHFALPPHPQFHPQPQALHHLHPQFQPPPPASSSPFTHLPHHHELSFRYPPPRLPASAPAAAAAAQQQLRQQQQHQPPPLPTPAVPQPAAPAQKESAPAGVKRRGGPGGLSKVCGVSPQLQAIVGEPTMARTQIVKQLWAYIRKNNLQDPNNKRKIICNDELRLVFETDCTDMFKMNKLLAKHIIPLESTRDPGPESKKLKATATEVVSATEPDVDQYPVVISDALANFFGTGEREMLQSEALRRIWDYIKNNRLEMEITVTSE
ncbi:formin-like protein 18 isoform X2 [Phoenix dactylifera]|uniref:Formin-like protein 18 isoform X2 n=1 Tax=Phoenix dactylifera TaxID=42345 RepID=A0A8B8J6W6_PHODC|nr:formin-like protein 18 isoform X2 [Phoenix dactylifera]